jgi:predicted Zn-dependent protease
VPDFLYALQRQSEIEAALDGQKNAGMNYFSTHPATADRVAKTQSEASSVGVRGVLNKTRHLNAINGMTYGDSADQGFTKGNTFYHPQMDFKFTVPNGFRIKNQPSQILATSQSGSVIIFDVAPNKGRQDAATYLQHVWMEDAPKGRVDAIKVNGRNGATLSFEGAVNGQPMTVRLVAIEWGDRFARFQIAIPRNASAALVEDLKRTTYSFDNLTAQDKSSAKPMRVALYTAKSGDTVASIAKYFPFDSMQQERFRVLNGLKNNENVQAGEVYKIVTH